MIRVGNVYSIPVGNKRAYFQYVNRHKAYGSQIRVFHNLQVSCTTELYELVRNKSDFVTFFPLAAAISRKIVKFEQTMDIPIGEEAFPIFKAGVVDPKLGTVKVWWLWDGEKEWQVGNLDKAQEKYPLRGVINDTLLVERIEGRWIAELVK